MKKGENTWWTKVTCKKVDTGFSLSWDSLPIAEDYVLISSYEVTSVMNEYITARFKELGAELKSLTCDDIEYIWPGDEKIWPYSAPLLFPMCSGLIDNEYCFNGKMYPMQKHGYARFCRFKVETLQEEKVTFLLSSDEESRKCYPFDYELRVIYSLEEKS